MRRVAPVGLSVLAAAGLAIAGCTAGSTTSTTPSASPSTAATGAGQAAPKDALLASIEPLTKTSYKYTLSAGGLTGQGANDPASKKATLALTGTAANAQQQGGSITINVVAIGTDVWMKLDFGSANSTPQISAVQSTYSDYGTAVSVTMPDPAQVTEAPDSLYQIFKK